MNGGADSTGPTRVSARVLLALTVATFALVEGVLVLRDWTATGTVPGARHLADTTALVAWSALAVLVLVALVRRACLERCALAALAWSFAVSVSADLPVVALSHEFCDGPALRGLYFGLGLCAGLWALSTSIADTRLCAIALIVFWSAANARLWGRESDRVWVLLWAALWLSFGCGGAWRGLGQSLAGAGRSVGWLCLLLLGWLALAAAFSDSPTISATAWLRVLWGALFAMVIAAGGRSAAGMVWGGLLAGAVAAVLVLVTGLAEAAHFSSLDRALDSRLRLLGLHSNLIAPFFALCLCVMAGELVRASSQRRLRSPRTVALLVVCGGLAFGLLRSESRASVLGLVLGLAGLAWCLWAPAPRRLWAVGIAGMVLLGTGLVYLATPLAAPLHERLRALTFTQSALGQRYYLWNLAAEVLAEHPLLGAGPNVYYLHARHAEPSFFDQTPQTLHSHSLFVGVAEGSGWIGLLLLLLVCLAACDALRRAARADGSSFEQRALAAGMLAALLAILASNSIDVGQSRNTFLPLVLWVALGVGAACLAPAVADRAGVATAPGTRLRAWLACALLVPLVVLPALAFHSAAAARAHLQANQPARALESGQRALALWPLEPKVRLTLLAARRARSDAEGARVEARALVATCPGFAAYHMFDAQAELDCGDPERAREAAERALQCDPRGQNSGDAWFMLAGARLRLADRAGAQAALLEGLHTEAGGWRNLPQARVPRSPGSGTGISGLAFIVGEPARPVGYIELDALLTLLEEEARETFPTQPLETRRLVGRVVGLLRAQGEAQRALDLLDEFARTTKFQNLSFDLLRIGICAELGRVEEADALRQASPWGDDSHIVAAWARALLAGGGAESFERVMAAAPLLERSGGRDVFFDAGTMVGPLALAAQLALRHGDGPHAFELLRRARYDCSTPSARLSISQDFLALCAEIGPPRSIALDALGEVLYDASLDRRAARDEKAMRRRAKLLREAGRDAAPSVAELEPVCRGRGEAGATFLRIWGEPSRN